MVKLNLHALYSDLTVVYTLMVLYHTISYHIIYFRRSVQD